MEETQYLDLTTGKWENPDGQDQSDISIVYGPSTAEKLCVDTNSITKEDKDATKLTLTVKNRGECSIEVQLRNNGADVPNAKSTINSSKTGKVKNKSGFDGFTITCGNCEDKKCKFSYSYGFA